MSEKRCLYCYKELDSSETDFHHACSMKIFGQPVPPEFLYSEDEIPVLGKEVIKSHIALTGVQPKLPLHIKDKSEDPSLQFEINGLADSFILKPPVKLYPYLPEIEDVTMHLAELSGIAAVFHSLIRLQSGNLAYLTKRIDRKGNKKVHMEDMCQLTERLTDYKYNGSYEQIAKAILKYSSNPSLDVVNYFEQVIFSFLTGNADMHLKNFSLLKDPEMGYRLCPAYDMVASALVVMNDFEELALNLNGKKRKLQRRDFITAMQISKISDNAIEDIFRKFETSIPDWLVFVKISFLPEEMQNSFLDLIEQRAERLELKWK